MAHFVIPSRRTRQPQGAVRVDWSNPLARGLIFAYQPSVGAVDLTRGDVSSLTGSRSLVTLPPYERFRGGRGALLTNAPSGYELFRQTSIPVAQLSCHVRGAFTGYDPDMSFTVRCGRGGVSGFEYSSYGIANVASSRFVLMGVAVYDSTTTADWYGGAYNLKVHAFGCSHQASTVTHYFDGAQLGSPVSTSGGSISPERLDLFAVSFIYEQALLWNRSLSADEHLQLNSGDYSLFAPDPRRLYFGASGGGATATTINAETGVFALTGAAATLNRGRVPLDAQPTSYAVSGTAATLARGWNLDAQPGTFAVSGTAATLARGWNLDAQPSTFAVSGTDATLARGWNLDAQPGAFELTGIAATLEYVQPGATTLDGQPGVFAISGAAATLTYVQLTHYVIDAQPGTFTFTGVAGTLTYNQLNAYEITASPGTFAVTGADAALTYTLASIWTDINPASSIWTDIDPNTIWTGL